MSIRGRTLFSAFKMVEMSEQLSYCLSRFEAAKFFLRDLVGIGFEIDATLDFPGQVVLKVVRINALILGTRSVHCPLQFIGDGVRQNRPDGLITPGDLMVGRDCCIHTLAGRKASQGFLF